MEPYEIIITSDAEGDLLELRNYIADVLLCPDIALSYIKAIRKEIATLSEMPGRIKPVDEEPLKHLFHPSLSYTYAFSLPPAHSGHN